MQAYRVETTLEQDGKVTLDDLPLHAGDSIEVIILVRSAISGPNAYPLSGTPVQYIDPTEPVAEQDWELLQ